MIESYISMELSWIFDLALVYLDFVITTETELSFWPEMELPNSSEVRAKAEERKHKRVQDQLQIKLTVEWKQYDSLPSVKEHQNQSI